MMMLLMIRCPAKNKPFAVHYLEIRDDKEKLPNRLTFSHCPHCGAVHGWRPNDTFVSDEPNVWGV